MLLFTYGYFNDICSNQVDYLIFIYLFLQYGDMYNLNQQAFEKALDKEGGEEDDEVSIF